MVVKGSERQFFKICWNEISESRGEEISESRGPIVVICFWPMKITFRSKSVLWVCIPEDE